MLLDGTSLLVDRIAADILSCSDQRKRHGGNTQDVTARSVSLSSFSVATDRVTAASPR
ncbi:hypothetical protein [Streptomyces sp. WY228]|uniref:hypothetical protein n=1 Tax=Streptomyces TaxID=1883 RepID=UPI001C4E5179|nr:hypothetical protein KV381_10875 [Streptomyces sp. WY228]